MKPATYPTGVRPYITLNGRSREAIETWARAFGAVEVSVHREDGRIRHAEVSINGGPVFITDFHMDPANVFQPTGSIAMHLAVEDGSAWMERAASAGCRVMTRWQQLDFGGFGRVVDRFGLIWSIASPNVTRSAD